jgi:hypothetical protein
MINEKSLANLRPRKKGDPAISPGRPPKSMSLINRMRDKLAEVCEFDAKGRTWLECLAEAELKHALNETAARNDLFNRLFGKPLDSISVNESSGGLIVRVVYGDKPADEDPTCTENPEN